MLLLYRKVSNPQQKGEKMKSLASHTHNFGNKSIIRILFIYIKRVFFAVVAPALILFYRILFFIHFITMNVVKLCIICIFISLVVIFIYFVFFCVYVTFIRLAFPHLLCFSLKDFMDFLFSWEEFNFFNAYFSVLFVLIY